jgi:hypothetical protein
MSRLSKSARIRFTLNGKEVDAPLEWQDISISANFQNSRILSEEPTIEIDSFNFVNEEAESIRQWIADGKIYEGLPFVIDAYNSSTSTNAFTGYINCANNIKILDDTTLEANIQEEESLDSLKDRLSGITFSYLESIGVFTQADYTSVKYVVEKSDNKLEILMNTVIAYMLIVQLQTQIEKTSKSIADALAHATGGITGTAAAAVFAAAVAIINVIFTLFMITAIINLAIVIFDSLIPIIRTHKTLKLRTALSKIAGYIGYSLSSPIALLDSLHYLPSNLETDEVSLSTGLINIPKGTGSGVPNERDYGFTAIEFFDLCERMFNADLKIVGNAMEFRSRNDPFWKQTATYKMPNILRPEKRYNTNEIIFSRMLRFDTDEIADEWTINNFRGTNYEIITQDLTISNQKANYIKGHETIAFPVALGNRKDKLNGLENSLSDLAGIVDTTINFFGGNSNLQGKIKARVGMLKVGTNNTTKPKILYLAGTKLPPNHRTLFSAKALWGDFINEKSFVLNNFGGQKALYSLNDLPFGLEGFLESIKNSNFTDSDNSPAKFRTLNWTIDGDTAEAEFEQHEIYAPNLTESYIETQ